MVRMTSREKVIKVILQKKMLAGWKFLLIQGTCLEQEVQKCLG